MRSLRCSAAPSIWAAWITEYLADHPQQLAYLPVFEIVGVDLDEIAPLLGNLVLGKDSVHRTRIHARAAVDALVRVDVIHRRGVVRVDAVDGTNLYA
jgi:hypothetical protein